MGKFTGWLTTLAIGAGLMYLFDPDRGNRRRALLRDRYYGMKNDFNEVIDVGVEDLQNQAQGITAEISSMFTKERVSDRVLEERVRSRLGYLVPNASAVQVNINDGMAQLSGDLLAEDVDSLMRGVAKYGALRVLKIS
jgi:hypothetical protein